MTYIADIFAPPHSGFFRRQTLLLRQDFHAWRMPVFFSCLLCMLAVEAIRTMHSVEMRLVIGRIFLALCLFFFIAGTFADLARPQARQHWLLLPAALWEKLLSRWLCSAVLFPALTLSVAAAWFLLRNTDPECRQWLHNWSAASGHLGTIRDYLLTFGANHALIFFIGSLLRTKSRTLPAYMITLLMSCVLTYIPLFLVGLFTGAAGAENMRSGFLLLCWPLTWLVFKRSKA